MTSLSKAILHLMTSLPKTILFLIFFLMMTSNIPLDDDVK